jgi:hypothetical protein
VHPVLRSLAEHRYGLFTAADARSAGYEHHEIRRLLTSGEWVRLRRGVYITADELAALEQGGRRHRVDCLAVLLELQRPTAAISHGSAAVLWGLPVRRHRMTAVRLTDPTLSRRGRGYRISQAPLRRGEVVRGGPLRFTSAERTLTDCAREWEVEDAVVAMDAALLRGRTTKDQLRRAVDAVRGWPRAGQALRAVALADGRAESALETRGRLRIFGSGLPAPELQVEIRAAGRLVAVVDAWYEEAAVAVEFDGRVKYTDPWRGRTPERVLWEEKRREDEVRSLDIRVVRIADADLDSTWLRTEARLRELLAGPGPAVRRFVAIPREIGRLRAG